MKTPLSHDHPLTGPRAAATAWALDELPADERAAFEQQLDADPQLAALAEDTKTFCGLLGHTLREPVPSLAERDRAELFAAAGKPRRRKSVIWIPWAAGAAAACVAGGVWWQNQQQDSRLVANVLTTTRVMDAPAPRMLAEPAPAAAPVPGIPVVSNAVETIKPEMPKPLFAGTPLPDANPPKNLDQSVKPVLQMTVPAGVKLISAGKPATTSDPAPLGEMSLLTDGDKQGDDGYFVDLLPGKQWVQIDLGQSMEIHLIWLWHFHKQAVVFKDVVIQISDDADFQKSATVFNNDEDNSSGFGAGTDMSWVETNNGRPIPVKAVTGRYVRLYSNGRNIDDTNQYLEVEVYGRPPAATPPALIAAAAPPPAPPATPAPAEPLLAQLAQNETAPERARMDALTEVPPASGPAPAAAAPQRAKADIAAVESDITIRPEMPKPLFAGTPLPLTWAAKPARGSDLSQLASASEARSFSGESIAPPIPQESGTESYQQLAENAFRTVTKEPLSTFSIDVDTASYSNVRRFLNQGQAPPAAAVRLEELVNYFPYNYPQPVDGKPFAVNVEMTSAPWNANHRLARIALKGKEIAQGERPPANLVFLVDVSGSMDSDNKLPLVKKSLRFVVERLTDRDSVSLVTYAGVSGVALPATSGSDKARILAAIDSLGAGGSTNGASGIETAYAQAALRFHREGINRVVLATDGDFNVGTTSHGDLLSLITEKAKSGVFLSVLGYGMGNIKDDTLELLADKGNGNYAYIDSLSEARKSLAEQLNGTLVTIAKDVKIQIEFNPAVIHSYRLMGYENRMLAKEDFNDDKKDAGEIGAGHTVTALYELVPVGAPEERVTTVDELKYQQRAEVPLPVPPATPVPAANPSGETMTVKLRWKAPDADQSQLMEVPVKDAGGNIAAASQDTRWAVAVAGFASLLNDSRFPGLSWDRVRELAKAAKGEDPNGYRGEFLQLLDKAESVKR